MPPHRAAFCRELECGELSTISLIIAEMLLRYIWFNGGVGYTGRGHGFSYTLARGMGKYEYCSKEGGSHGSNNLGATMDRAQRLTLCNNCAVVQAR